MPNKDIPHELRHTGGRPPRTAAAAMLIDRAMASAIRSLVVASSAPSTSAAPRAPYLAKAAGVGATAEEVAEALGVAIRLHGGRGTVHPPRALEAFLEFAKK